MQPSYDVIVVGSGASGGWAAKQLSEAGLRVAMLDAGRPQQDKNFTEHEQAYQLKYRNQADAYMRRTRPVQKDCYACMEYNADWFCNDIDEPYTTAAGKPFSWQGRTRMIGAAPTSGDARAIVSASRTSRVSLSMGTATTGH